ncbi:MAG: SLBB domain-containing protein, partial [Mameliella sp.]|nr:SLBB domain-containing protein [Phaeodactylibacter sp.]
FFTFLNENDSLVSDKLEIFGMDIFRSGDIAFEPSLNIATPENYVLGAGDEIIIDVYGASEITYQEIISPDGNILISGIGPISLGGITVKEAKRRIFNKLSNIYSGIEGSNPNTFLQVSVGQIRSIKVNVVGNVVQPGTYTLSSFASAFNALYFAGGPTENGSLRQIEIVRKGEKIATLDVYKYLFLGDDSQNPQLQDQDVIVVKPYVNRVKLAGNVKHPAIYELKKGEPFSFLLEISGGFSSGAYRKLLTIDRIGIEKREVETIMFEDFHEAALSDGDSIFVKKISSRYLNRVQIVGAVDQPGFYELDEELTLAKLIEMAGGVREDAYLMRGNIVRLTSNLRMRNLTFSVLEVINGAQDIVLKADDMVKISSIFELEEDQTVTLIGEVRNAGEYPYIDSMTVEDLINLSGGLTSKATSSQVEVARRLRNSSDLSQSSEIFTFKIAEDLSIDSGSDFLLKPFDIISIKSSSTIQIQKVIKIEGEVKYPGFYALKTNEDKISDLIDRAGGLTEYGYAEGASLIRRTEYYRTEFEKEELDALLELRRKELETRYANEGASEGSSIAELIQMELNKYEKEITENIKKSKYSNELEARIFRAQQLRKLQQRDSIAGAYDIVEQQGIGIQLKKILDSPDSPEDLILKDGDIISIPRQLETVRVQGE